MASFCIQDCYQWHALAESLNVTLTVCVAAQLMALIQPEVVTAITKMIDKLLRPATLLRVAEDVFERCDEMTKYELLRGVYRTSY